MSVSRLTQVIRIRRGLLVLTATAATACVGDDIAWTDPQTTSALSSDARLAVDDKGRARLVPDTSISLQLGTEHVACVGSIRAARLDDGTLAATWWSVRPDSSVVLLAALSPDNGSTWTHLTRVDTSDIASTGCNRPPPSIAASAGFTHIAYAMRASEGVGVFYAHSMNAGQSYEAPVIILYGDRLTRSAIAADKGTIAVAYEDPSGSSPQIGLAISRDWGHIFRDRMRGSTGVGTAADPQVAVHGREIAISWLVGPTVAGGVGGETNSDTRATRIVRVGRLQ